MKSAEGTDAGTLRPARANVTMRDVAERAGVSLMTVSRVINNATSVTAKTRDRVEQVVAELGYRPNLGARRLAGGRSMFVGLLYNNPSPGYLSKVLTGGLNACREHGHHLVLEDFAQSAPYSDPVPSVRALNLADLDGLVVTPPLSVHQPFMEALRTSGLPTVSIAPDETDRDGLWVAMDDELAVEDMVAFIAAQGHTRIGFVRGPDDHAASRLRWQGFVRGMAAHGLSIEEASIRLGDFTYPSGLLAGLSLLRADNPPTAVIASNDDMAAGVIGAAHQMGVSVPSQLSVAGFDDIELARTVWPELTTVRQPIAAMTARAVALLTAHLNGKASATQGVTLPHEIVERGSVAPPPR